MATERIQIPMDRFGRVVLPKEIRERLGVAGGTEFEVEEKVNAILLRPVIQPAKVVNKGGWLVIQGEGRPSTDEVVHKTTEKIRKERMERFVR